MSAVTLLLPVLDEEAALPATLANIAALDPPPDEVIMVDGGSTDRTVALAEAAGIRVIACPTCGRGPQINLGVAEAAGPLVLVLHADSLLPPHAIAHVRSVMADRRIALASFSPRIGHFDREGRWRTRRFTTAHNWWKTWYPAVTHPHLFWRGVRLIFGDHAMFFRRADYLAIGGIPAGATVMEEADLCIGLARLGRLKVTREPVLTSDRRIAAWGFWRANWIYLKVGILWSLGAREKLRRLYPDVR